MSSKLVHIHAHTVVVTFIIIIVVVVVVVFVVVVRNSKQTLCDRRKEQTEPIYAKPGQWASVGSSDSGGILISQLQQGASLSTRRPHAQDTPSFDVSAAHGAPLSARSPHGLPGGRDVGQHEDYENVPSKEPRSVGPRSEGFVTNDIYETCRNSSTLEAGWVENDIYGY